MRARTLLRRNETKVLFCLVAAFSCVTRVHAETIPVELWGKWVIARVLPTRTIACWGDAHAKTLLNTEIEYSGDFFRWKDVITHSPDASREVVSAERFHDDNSGRGTNSSQVTFHELGISSNQAIEISIKHPPADITGATVEIPGDRILLKDKNTIILSVCNMYFEAHRVTTK